MVPILLALNAVILLALTAFRVWCWRTDVRDAQATRRFADEEQQRWMARRHEIQQRIEEAEDPDRILASVCDAFSKALAAPANIPPSER
jgi:hypothetical protein